MPLEALSAKASEMVPVGAMDSRWLLRRPCFLTSVLMSLGRREAKLPPERYSPALNSGKAPRPGQIDGIEVGGVAHVLGNARRHGAGFRFVVAQAQHGQGIARAGIAQADAALVGGFLGLTLQRPVGGIRTLSSMRVETRTTSPKASKSKAALSEKASLTNRVRLMDPRQQQP